MLMMTMMMLIADADDGGDDAYDVDKGCLLVRIRVSQSPIAAYMIDMGRIIRT